MSYIVFSFCFIVLIRCEVKKGLSNESSFFSSLLTGTQNICLSPECIQTGKSYFFTHCTYLVYPRAYQIMVDKYRNHSTRLRQYLMLETIDNFIPRSFDR